MKKILIGLLAVSATAFSAITLDTPANGTNVFKPEQEGRIGFEGVVKSLITPVKYVVFANDTDSFTGAESELTLPDILLSQAAITNMIDGTPSNIYVRKVNGAQDDVEALGSEKVYFTINFDEAYTGIANRKIGTNQNIAVAPTALMNQAELAALIAGISGATVNTQGLIENAGKAYKNPKNVVFYSDAEGVLKVKMETNTGFVTNAMDLTAAEEVEALFTTQQPFTGLTISVVVR